MTENKQPSVHEDVSQVDLHHLNYCRVSFLKSRPRNVYSVVIYTVKRLKACKSNNSRPMDVTGKAFHVISVGLFSAYSLGVYAILVRKSIEHLNDNFRSYHTFEFHMNHIHSNCH